MVGSIHYRFRAHTNRTFLAQALRPNGHASDDQNTAPLLDIDASSMAFQIVRPATFPQDSQFSIIISFPLGCMA